MNFLSVIACLTLNKLIEFGYTLYIVRRFRQKTENFSKISRETNDKILCGVIVGYLGQS